MHIIQNTNVNIRRVCASCVHQYHEREKGHYWPCDGFDDEREGSNGSNTSHCYLSYCNVWIFMVPYIQHANHNLLHKHIYLCYIVLCIDLICMPSYMYHKG